MTQANRSLDDVTAEIDYLNDITYRRNVDDLLISLPRELCQILGDNSWLFLIDLVDEILSGDRSRGRSVEGALLCLERLPYYSNGFPAEVLGKCSPLIRNRLWPECHAKRLMRSLCDQIYYYREPKVYWEHCALSKWCLENYEFSRGEQFGAIANTEKWIQKRFLGLERLEREEIIIPASTIERVFSGVAHEVWLRNGFLLKHGGPFREFAAVSMQLKRAYPVMNLTTPDLWMIQTHAPAYKSVERCETVSINFVWKKEEGKQRTLIDAEALLPWPYEPKYGSRGRDSEML